MANRGWDDTLSGEALPSNARTTGRTSGLGNAESFVRGSQVAHPAGGDNDPLATRADLVPARDELDESADR